MHTFGNSDPVVGRYMVAARDIEAGEVIFNDEPACIGEFDVAFFLTASEGHAHGELSRTLWHYSGALLHLHISILKRMLKS